MRLRGNVCGTGARNLDAHGKASLRIDGVRGNAASKQRFGCVRVLRIASNLYHLISRQQRWQLDGMAS